MLESTSASGRPTITSMNDKESGQEQLELVACLTHHDAELFGEARARALPNTPPVLR